MFWKLRKRKYMYNIVLLFSVNAICAPNYVFVLNDVLGFLLISTIFKLVT